MRVLHMIPDIGISNGVMSVILNYFKAMPNDIKFDVVYFVQTDKTRQSDVEKLGGRVFKIDAPSPKDLFTGKMNRFFAEHKNEWEALHIHCPHFAAFIAPCAQKAGIKKIAVHCHSTCFSLKGNRTRNRLLSLYAKYFIKDKFACSAEAGKLWYGSKKFTVLNNAIDCNRYSFDENVRNAMRTRMGLADCFTVGHIGRTDIMQKNHPFLLEVFSYIVKKNKASKLLLMGAEKSIELAEQCRKLDLEDHVEFLGMRNDIADLLQACDAFLFPSISEGLPVSVIEAQASDLPVLISDSVTAEVCVSSSIYTMPLSDSPQDWAKKLVDISSEHQRQPAEWTLKSNWDIYACAKKLTAYYNGELYES